MTGRQEVLERLGRYYGREKFAVAFTAGITGPDAKRVTTAGWDKTAPLPTADFGAGLIATRGQRANVVIVLRPSNLIVIECDTEPDLVRIEELGLPVTVTVRSSEPYKRHYWFRPPATLETIPYVAFRFESGKLTADSGRYFLAPPSIHPTGQIYEHLPGLGPDEVPIAELPDQTYRQLSEQARREDSTLRQRIEIDPDAKIKAGNRRDMLFRYACMLRRWGLSRAEISAATHDYNEARCEPPVDRDLVEVQVDGAMKKQGGQELTRPAPHVNGAPVLDPEPEAVPAVEEHSWQPIDLIANAYDPPPPPTISGMVYPGRRHVFSGEPESLKSWAGLILCAEQIAQAHTVMYVDFEMGAQETLARLRSIGLTDQQINEHVLYLEPDEAFTDSKVSADTDQLLRERKVTLIIIDAFTGALQTHGLKPNEGVDVETFYRRVVDPLRKHGAGVVLLDHLQKDPTTRGKFAIGSERKIGACEVHLGFEVITPFGRGRIGRARITVHKDRPGHLPRPRLGDLEVTSDKTTGQITWRVERVPEDDEQRDFRPTVLMERVSTYLEEQDEPASKKSVELAIKGSHNGVRIAIGVLLRERYIEHIPGPRGAHLLASVMPYRQADDPVTHPTSPTSPDLAPTSPGPGGEATSPTSPTPLQGVEVAPRRAGEDNQPQLALAQHDLPPLDDTLAPEHHDPPADLDHLPPTSEGWDA